MVRNLAVLGSPIEHSKSPLIHGAAYRVLGLEWHYERIEVRKGALKPFIEPLNENWLGFSVTMPLKEEAFRFATELDEESKLTGAVNTLVRTPNGWSGYNTDVFGITRALESAQLRGIKEVLVIGSGATAYSAIVALRSLAPEAKILVHARNETTRSALIDFAQSIGFKAKIAKKLETAAKKADLTISTLPAHSLDGLASELLQMRSWQPKGALLDVAYQPWPSEISKLWFRNHNNVVSGIEMLFWQAVAQVRIFANANVDEPLQQEAAVLEAMRHALETSAHS